MLLSEIRLIKENKGERVENKSSWGKKSRVESHGRSPMFWWDRVDRKEGEQHGYWLQNRKSSSENNERKRRAPVSEKYSSKRELDQQM